MRQQVKSGKGARSGDSSAGFRTIDRFMLRNDLRRERGKGLQEGSRVHEEWRELDPPYQGAERIRPGDQEDEVEIEIPNDEEEEEEGFAARPWKLLEKVPERGETEGQEEDVEEWQEPEMELFTLEPPPQPPPPPPEPTQAEALPGQRPRKRRRRVAYDEASEEGLNSSIHLSNVPVEYTHATLVGLHESLELDASSLLTCKFMQPELGDEERTCKVLLRYVDRDDAVASASKLEGQSVTTSDGIARSLHASLLNNLGPTTTNPQATAYPVGRQCVRPPVQDAAVRAASRELVDFAKRWSLDDTAIAWLARLPDEVQTLVIDGFNPEDTTGNIMVKLGAFVRGIQEKNQKDHQPPPLNPGEKHVGTVKVWFEERGFGFIAPETGGPDVYVHRSVLSDGSFLEQECQVSFKAVWDPAKSKYLAQECWGALGERQESSIQPSDELRAFAERWSLDKGAVLVLARLPQEVQVHLMEQYCPEDSEACAGTEEDAEPGNNNLFVSGLPSDATEELIEQLFSEHGHVEQCRVLTGRNSRKLSDIAALVQMADADQAEMAILRLNQVVPDGMEAPLTVKYAASNAGKAKAQGKGKQTNHSKAVVMLARSLQAPRSLPTPVLAATPALVATPALAAPETRPLPAAPLVSSATEKVELLELGIMLPGTVKFWNEQKGYGFVMPDGGGPDVFVHRTSLSDGQHLVRDAEVSFEVEWDDETWRYRAVKCVGAVTDLNELPARSDPSLTMRPVKGNVGGPLMGTARMATGSGKSWRPPPPPPLPPTRPDAPEVPSADWNEQAANGTLRSSDSDVPAPPSGSPPFWPEDTHSARAPPPAPPPVLTPTAKVRPSAQNQHWDEVAADPSASAWQREVSLGDVENVDGSWPPPAGW